MRRLALLAVLVAAACGTVPSGLSAPLSTPVTTLPAPTPTTTVVSATTTTPQIDVAAWQSDLTTFVHGLEVTHPNPYWRVGEKNFRADVAAVARRLPALNTDQATVEIMRLAAEIDGHTQVFVGYLGWDFARIQFYSFEGAIGVVGAADPSLIGGRLVAVGHVPVDEAIKRVSVLASYDNPMTKAFTSPFLLTVPRLLAALDMTSDPTWASYKIEKLDGSSVTVAPETVSFTEYRQLFGDPVIGLPTSERALYLARRDSPYWWTTLDPATIYFQFNLTLDSAWDPFFAHTVALDDMVDQIDRALDEHPGARLVIDLRHNGGGDNQTYGELLDMLARRYGNRCGLFVLIGRATFSAAVNFATEVEQKTTATFIGEPTGGSPNLFADLATVTLRHSDIRVFVSHRYWPYGGPDDHRVWIDPDISAPPTLEDWNAGRDVALASAQVAADCRPSTGYRSGALGTG